MRLFLRFWFLDDGGRLLTRIPWRRNCYTWHAYLTRLPRLAFSVCGVPSAGAGKTGRKGDAVWRRGAEACRAALLWRLTAGSTP